MMMMLLATITHMEGGDEIDCAALFAYVAPDQLPQSPGAAFAKVDAMREFVRARHADQASAQCE